MRLQASKDITRTLKEKWDKSRDEDKKEWRVLTGRNLKGRYDMFVSSSERLWQLKFEQTGHSEAIGFGLEVGKIDDEIKELMRRGAPVPFGLISPQKADLAIMMAGIQQYSSDSSYTLCKEYISDKQAKLDEKLDREIERMERSDPVFRRRYKEQKEREKILYL